MPTHATLSGGKITQSELFPALKTPDATTAGLGIIAGTASKWTANVTDGQTMALIYLDFKASEPTFANSEFDGIRILTDSDAIDTAAGICIINTGQSDNIYLGVAGKPGTTESAPTGIGIDINRQYGGTAESSTEFRGFGIQIWDWSTTNQGGGPPAPRGLVLRKHSNPNTNHWLAQIYANRYGMVFETPGDHFASDPVTNGGYEPGYVADEPVIDLVDSGATITKWRLTAAGNQKIKNGNGLYWAQTTGNEAFIVGVNSEIQARIGNDGFKFLTNGGTQGFAVQASGYPWWSTAALTQTTVGAAGGASALPATPEKYLKIVDDEGGILLVPAYLGT